MPCYACFNRARDTDYAMTAVHLCCNLAFFAFMEFYLNPCLSFNWGFQ